MLASRLEHEHAIVWPNILLGSKEIGSEQIPKSTIAVLGKMPGSEGNHG